MENERTDSGKIAKLDGSNYQSWKFQMKVLLMNKDLWGYIQGSERIPDETERAEVKRKYRSRSDQAYSLIALSVETPLQIHIVPTTEPKEAWDILQEQFSFVSITHMVRLTRKFYAATMNEGDDLMEHITLMTTLAQQLRELEEVISTKKFAIVVLGSLPPSYDTYLISLNARKAEDLNWNSVKGSLQEEYMKRKEKKNIASTNDDALFMRNDSRNNNNNTNTRFNQQQQRHDNTRPHGNNNGRYDNNTRPHFNSGARQNTNKCFECGKPGHIARNCNTNNRFNNNYNSRSGRTEEGNFMSSFNDFSVQDEVALATSNYVTNHNEWFIDSAASKHMTYGN